MTERDYLCSPGGHSLGLGWGEQETLRSPEGRAMAPSAPQQDSSALGKAVHLSQAKLPGIAAQEASATSPPAGFSCDSSELGVSLDIGIKTQNLGLLLEKHDLWGTAQVTCGARSLEVE